MPEGAVQVRPSWALPAATPRFVGAASVLAAGVPPLCAEVRLTVTEFPEAKMTLEVAQVRKLPLAVPSLMTKAVPATFSVSPARRVLVCAPVRPESLRRIRLVPVWPISSIVLVVLESG